MRQDNKRFRLNSRTYWCSWLLVVAVFLFARYLVLVDTSDNLRFWVFNSYLLSLCILLLVFYFREGNRSFYYLEDNHPEIFQQVYGGKYFTPVFNSLRIYKFLHTKDVYGDPNIPILKSNGVTLYRLTLVSFFTCPIMFLLYMF